MTTLEQLWAYLAVGERDFSGIDLSSLNMNRWCNA